MPIYDNNGSASSEIGKLYDNNGSTSSQIGKVYDNNGTTSSLIYSAEVTYISSTITFGTWYLYTGESGSKNSSAFDLSSHSEVQITGTLKLVMTWSSSTYAMGATVGVKLILADNTAIDIASIYKSFYVAGDSYSTNFDKTLDLSSYSSTQLASCTIKGYMSNVYCGEAGKRIEGTATVTLVKGL